MAQFLCIKRISSADATWNAALQAKLEITVDLEIVEADYAELTANQQILIFTCTDARADFVKKELKDKYQISEFVEL